MAGDASPTVKSEVEDVLSTFAVTEVEVRGSKDYGEAYSSRSKTYVVAFLSCELRMSYDLLRLLSPCCSVPLSTDFLREDDNEQTVFCNSCASPVHWPLTTKRSVRIKDLSPEIIEPWLLTPLDPLELTLTASVLCSNILDAYRDAYPSPRRGLRL